MEFYLERVQFRPVVDMLDGPTNPELVHFTVNGEEVIFPVGLLHFCAEN